MQPEMPRNDPAVERRGEDYENKPNKFDNSDRFPTFQNANIIPCDSWQTSIDLGNERRNSRNVWARGGKVPPPPRKLCRKRSHREGVGKVIEEDCNYGVQNRFSRFYHWDAVLLRRLIRGLFISTRVF